MHFHLYYYNTRTISCTKDNCDKFITNNFICVNIKFAIINGIYRMIDIRKTNLSTLKTATSSCLKTILLQNPLTGRTITAYANKTSNSFLVKEVIQYLGLMFFLLQKAVVFETMQCIVVSCKKMPTEFNFDK